MAHIDLPAAQKAYAFTEETLTPNSVFQITVPQAAIDNAAYNAFVQLQGGSARVTFDGSDPTATRGYAIEHDGEINLRGELMGETKWFADGPTAPLLSVHFFA